MKILALEFSSPQRSVAVVARDGFHEALSGSNEPFTMIEQVLREAKLEREQIGCIVVGLGPGSYTGIRSAISIAQGWQFARPIHLLGISSVECIATQAHADGATGRVNVIVDAQREEFYIAGYEFAADGVREIEPLRIVTGAEVKRRAETGEVLIGPEVSRWFPSGKTVFPRAAVLGRMAHARTDFISGEKLEPIYLRETKFVKAPPPRTITLLSNMKAAVLYGKEDVRVEDVQPQPLKPGEVRIQIEAALTCGTDLKVFRRGYHAKMIVPPAVFGHELAGIVSEVHSPQSTVGIGDRVVVANSAPCGECFHCRSQQENICDDLLFLNGAYAESIVVPARIVQKNLLRLRGSTEFKDAALVEPLACVVQGIEDVKARAGQHLLVLGAGPIGLMFAALAKKLDCTVTVAGRRTARLDAAKKLGADHVIDIGDGNNLVTKVREASKEHFDVVIEAVGNPAVWEASVHLVRKGGTVNFFGGCPSGTTVTLDTTLIHYSNLTLLASFHHTPRTIRRALEFIEAGVVTAADFVDGECALSQLPQLLKSMTEGNRVVKTLVRVRE